MADEFGSGPALDPNFDFEVSSTGDLDIERGISELKKDLAVYMVIGLNKYLGRPPSGNINEKVLATASAIAEADTRVLSVQRSRTDVTFSPDREEITINLTVLTVDGEQELVFNI